MASVCFEGRCRTLICILFVLPHARNIADGSSILEHELSDMPGKLRRNIAALGADSDVDGGPGNGVCPVMETVGTVWPCADPPPPCGLAVTEDSDKGRETPRHAHPADLLLTKNSLGTNLVPHRWLACRRGSASIGVAGEARRAA
jgi:hypothetical protein